MPFKGGREMNAQLHGTTAVIWPFACACPPVGPGPSVGTVVSKHTQSHLCVLVPTALGGGRGQGYFPFPGR